MTADDSRLFPFELIVGLNCSNTTDKCQSSGKLLINDNDTKNGIEFEADEFQVSKFINLFLKLSQK